MQVTRRGTAIGGLLIAGGALANEMLGWAVGKVADAVWAGKPQNLTWSTFPWLNTIGLLCLVAAISISVWPRVRRWFSSEEPTLYDDRELRDKIATIKADIDNAQLHGLADRVSAIEASAAILDDLKSRFDDFIRSFDPLIRRLDHQDKRSRAHKIAQIIEAAKPKLPTEADMVNGLPQRPRRWLEDRDDIILALTDIGVPDAEIREALKKAMDEVLLNGANSTLGIGEDKIFIDNKEKQRWNICIARLDALMNLLGERGWL